MKNKIYILLITTLFPLCLFAQQFESILPQQSGIDFINRIVETRDLNVLNYEYMYNGGGVAIGDINNDGLQDIYFTTSYGSNKLYLNKGDFTFEDITQNAGVGLEEGIKSGVSMVDINQDGWLDIYVCRSGPIAHSLRKNVLFINNKNETFSNQSEQYGLADSSFSTQAYFMDFDKDGDLDLYLLNHPYNIGEAKTMRLMRGKNGEVLIAPPRSYNLLSDRFYENKNGKFIDQSKKAGVLNEAFGLSAVVDDFNQDGFPDVYVCNDYTKPDYLYINQKDGTFKESFDDYFHHSSYSSMGSDYADINNDGLPDLFVVDMLYRKLDKQKMQKPPSNYDEFFKRVKYKHKHQYLKNVLQLNNGIGKYSDISYYNDLAFTDWSWAPLIADFDNDGWKDLYVTNGFMREITNMDFITYKANGVRNKIAYLKNKEALPAILDEMPEYKTSNYFFKNQKDLQFSNDTKSAGVYKESYSNGAAYGDLDNDGDLDIIVNNINDFAFAYQNKSQSNYINIELKNGNKSCFGTKIEIKTADGINQTATHYPTKGFLSSHSPMVHFGIGQNTQAQATIFWPDGQVQKQEIQQGKHVIVKSKTTKRNQPHKQKVAIAIDNKISQFTPKENEYIDFKLEPLLPKQYSKLGPAAAAADVNNDGLDDLFIGGAKDKTAVLFIQQQDGSFTQQSLFEKDKKYEDVSAAFFDADGDQDLDLIVLSGGNEYPNQKEKYPVRLYLNNGKGLFTKDKNFPIINESTQALCIGDYDQDGDQDIFIGGRIIPGHYGLLPQSYLLKNKNGQFSQAKNWNGNKIGMCTSAIFSDYDQDGDQDLMVVGEWMPLSIFKNYKGKISAKPTIINNSNGWWNVIKEINTDNDNTYILGNLGLNARYKSNPTGPLKMYVSDFDENGSTDCVITTTQNGKEYPMPLRDNLLDQMVFLKKKFIRYSDYASATIEEVLGNDLMNKADIFKIDDFKSKTLSFKNGQAYWTDLPYQAQLFPIKDALLLEKGKLLLAGNEFNTEVETGRLDGGQGVIYDINTSSISLPQASGIIINGDVRRVLSLKSVDKTYLINIRNNESSNVLLK